jgi:hypothetical protein
VTNELLATLAAVRTTPVPLATLEATAQAPAVDPNIAALTGVVATAMHHIGLQSEAMMKLASALAARENLTTVNVAAPAVTVEPPAVNVTNEVPVPSVVVAPPNVTVESPVVNVTNEVQPADVTVDVNLPPRETTTEITRDRDGDIVDIKQTERTIN